MPRYGHVGVVVRELGLSRDTWRRWADEGKVRALRPGGPRGARIFDIESCREFLSSDHRVTLITPTRAGKVESLKSLHKAFMATVTP